eukprot:475841-Prorocentrum_lima.AAC.1
MHADEEARAVIVDHFGVSEDSIATASQDEIEQVRGMCTCLSGTLASRLDSAFCFLEAHGANARDLCVGYLSRSGAGGLPRRRRPDPARMGVPHGAVAADSHPSPVHPSGAR